MFKMGLLDPEMHRTNSIQNMKKNIILHLFIVTNICGTYYKYVPVDMLIA